MLLPDCPPMRNCRELRWGTQPPLLHIIVVSNQKGWTSRLRRPPTSPQMQDLDEVIEYAGIRKSLEAFSLGWNMDMTQHLSCGRFDTLPVPDCAELFAAWVCSDRQAVL